MITTYYLFTVGGTPRYKIHLVSVICANKNNKPVPNYKVIAPRKIEQPDHTIRIEPKQIFSNFMVENGAVTRFNSCKYEEKTSSLDNIKDARWIPFKTARNVGNVFYRYSYMNTLNLSTTHTDGVDDSLFLFLKSEGRNLGERRKWFSPYAVVDPDVNVGRPTMGEWPSPIVIRVDDGTIVRFYEPDDTNFSTPIYWLERSSSISGLNVIFVYNLIPNKTYNYKVFKKVNNNYTLKTGIYGQNNNYGTIRTEGQIRMIKFEGVRNARDIGGWPTLDGGKFKYGLIYRGSLLDAANGRYNVQTESINCASDKKEFFKLNIERELDLRATGDLSTDNDVFGDINSSTYMGTSKMIRINNKGVSESTGISYYRWGEEEVATPAYQGWKDNIRQFIGYLNAIIEKASQGKASYVHCVEGKDRTGTFLLLLEALCDVKSDALIKDYELSNMWTPNTYNRFTLQQGNLKDNVTVGKDNNSTLLSFNVVNKDNTIQGGVQKWFSDRYSKSSIKVINRKTQTSIAKASEAIDYLRDVFIEKKLNVNTEVILLGGSRILNKATVYNASGNVETEITSPYVESTNAGAAIPAGNGVKAQISGTSISVNKTKELGETVTNFKCNNTITNNILILDNQIIIAPITTNNLISAYTKYRRWSPVAFQCPKDDDPSIYYTRYYLKRDGSTSSNKSFYALAPFFAKAGVPITINIPSKTGNVILEIIETGITGLGPDTTDPVAALPIGYNREYSLTLNSSHNGTYTPSLAGFIFINVAYKASGNYTVFSEADIPNIKATVSGCKVPSFYCEYIKELSRGGLSMVYYAQDGKEYVIAIHDSLKNIDVIDLKTGDYIKEFSFGNGNPVFDSANHALTSCILPVKWDSSDFFPLILVGSVSNHSKVIRIAGNPSNSSSLSVSHIQKWKYPYNGEILYSIQSNTLYLSRYGGDGHIYTIDANLTDINTYKSAATLTFSENNLHLVSDYRVGGQDMTIMNNSSTGNKDVIVHPYGYIGYEPAKYDFYENDNNLCGIVFMKMNTPGSADLIGFLNLTELFRYIINPGYRSTENDGIAWAGNNVFYIRTNNPNTLCKFIIDIP